MWTVTHPVDEDCRWLISVDGQEPFRALLVAAGVEYPTMIAGRFRQGCGVLVAAELDETLPGKLARYHVLDWTGAPGTLTLGREVARWARLLNTGESPWDQVSVIAPREPNHERRELLQAHPKFMCRAWRKEWESHDFCLEVVKDRANRPACVLGSLAYESELPGARAALGRALCDLDEAYVYFESLARPKPAKTRLRDDLGIAGY